MIQCNCLLTCKDSYTTSASTFYFKMTTIPGKHNQKIQDCDSFMWVQLLVISRPCNETKQIPEQLLSRGLSP